MIFDSLNDFPSFIWGAVIGLGITKLVEFMYRKFKISLQNQANKRVEDFNKAMESLIFIEFRNAILKEYYGSEYWTNVYGKDFPVYTFEGIPYSYPFEELCNKDEKKFIYTYCNEPDYSMHDYGTDDERILKILEILNRKTEEFCEDLKDTLIIITADHGHITAGEYIILDNYPILKNMLIRETSLEPRATNFFVKNEMLEDFKKEFNNLFENDFILLSKQEIISKKLFGSGVPNEKFESCLGDYLAIAVSDKAIVDSHKENLEKGLHAGITEDEVLIPLIIVDNK